MTVDDEEQRAANEATFREANERIRQAQRELNPEADRLPYLCECEETSCHEPIPLTAEEYELVRDEPTYFFIVSGHPTRGEVVSERNGYTIVRKTGRGGVIAQRTDPREEDA